MGSHRLEILKSGRAWRLLGVLASLSACGWNADQLEQPTTSAFSEASCAAVDSDVHVRVLPDFSVTSPSSYNNCTKSYVVDIQGVGGSGGVQGDGTPGTGGSPGTTSHKDIVVSLAGTVPTTKAACEGLYAAAYFYTAQPPDTWLELAYANSSGVWLPQRGMCAPPTVRLRDFVTYITSPYIEFLRIASTMRDAAQNTLPLEVYSVRNTLSTPTGCSADAAYMLAGEGLFTNQFMYSCDGRFRLYMQDDGNLVLSQKDSHGAFSIALWTSHTNGATQANLLSMQGDGNLVIYAFDGTPLWASNTSGKPGLHLKIFNDGNMKLYDGTHGTAWQTNTGGH